jgi:indole-3-glycerol phosphate synthase
MLDAILASKRNEIVRLKDSWETDFTLRRAPLDVRPILRRPPGAPLRLIAEVKLKSPSAGPLSRVLGVDERVRAYAHAGASMVSVLCDGPFFDGSYQHLDIARATLDDVRRTVPLLAKEFVLDEVQLSVARAKGADCVLLIARILSEKELADLVVAAERYGLEPLVEVANDEELDRALRTHAHLIGVNARDLDTLRMDPERAASLVARIPPNKVAIHLSGLATEDDVRRIAAGRADAALIGEALMRQDDPTDLLSRLTAAAG